MEYAITIRNTDVKITDILEMISKGYSYKQIVSEHSELTMGDIMASAKTALDLIQMFVIPNQAIRIESAIEITAYKGKLRSLSDLRRQFPRAYEKWTKEEEDKAVLLHRNGKKISEIAETLQRQRGAVRTRLVLLGEIEGFGDTRFLNRERT